MKNKFLFTLAAVMLLGLSSANAQAEYKVRGTMNSWGCSDMVVNKAGDTCFLKVNGTVEFKITDKCAWHEDGAEEFNTIGENSEIELVQDGNNKNVKGGVSGSWYIIFVPTSGLITGSTLRPESEQEDEVEPEGDYFIKHPWNGGEWEYKPMVKQEDGIYTYTGLYGDNGVNIADNASGNNADWYSKDKIAGASKKNKGDEVTFVYDPAQKKVYIQGAEEEQGEGGDDGEQQGGEQQTSDYYIKHPWNGGSWEFKPMVKQEDGTYECTGLYGDNGVNIADNASGNNADWYSKDQIAGADKKNKGDEVTFVFDAAQKKVYIKGYEKEQGNDDGEQPQASEYYIKHPWGSGENEAWDWKAMTKQDEGIYVAEGLWGGVGANVNTQKDDVGAEWYPVADINGAADLVVGQEIRFTYNATAKTLEVVATGDKPENPDGPTDPENPDGPTDPDQPQATDYFLKHPWGTGADTDWDWKDMTKGDDGKYTVTGQWGGVGANVNTQKDDVGAEWYPADQIAGAATLSLGQEVTFVYDATSKSLSILGAQEDNDALEQVTAESLSVISEAGKLTITAKENVNTNIYSVLGARVGNINLMAGQTATIYLNSGVYVIGNVKVIVK